MSIMDEFYEKLAEYNRVQRMKEYLGLDTEPVGLYECAECGADDHPTGQCPNRDK